MFSYDFDLWYSPLYSFKKFSNLNLFPRWIPFLVFGFIGLLLAVVIFLFPKKVHVETHHNNELKNTDTIKVKLTNGSINNLEGVKLNVEYKEASTETESTPATNPDDEDVDDSFLHNEIKIPHHHSNEHNLTILNTLEQTGSILSMNQIGFYASHENVSQLNHKKISKTDSFKELMKKSLFLFKNPVYVFVITAATIEGLLQNSFLAFASLFLEYQYRLASGTSSFIIGILSIPPLIIGGLLSGIIVKKLKNDTVSCFKFLSVVLFINIFVYGGFLMHCKEPTLISNETRLKFLLNNEVTAQSECFRPADHNCVCNNRIFKPVCLSNSKDIYFQSPCLAGCHAYNSRNANNDFYSNCTQSNCDLYFQDTNIQKEHIFKDGLCPTNSCEWKLVISYVCIFLLMLLNALTFLPYLKVTIGCVDAKEMNTIILGLKQFFMNAFGTIPGPILFGSVIDATCTYWHTDSQNQSVCKIYHNRNFALGFGFLGIGFKTVCFLLVAVSLLISMRTAARKMPINTK